MGKTHTDISSIEPDTKLALLQLMFSMPPSRVGNAITTRPIYLQKNRTQVRVETYHQNLWVPCRVRALSSSSSSSSRWPQSVARQDDHVVDV